MRKLFITVVQLCSIIFVSFASLSVQVLYKNVYYYLSVYDTTPVTLETPLNALAVVDAQQNHRLLIDSFEKSRLNTLLFIGDFYDHDHRLQYIAPLCMKLRA